MNVCKMRTKSVHTGLVDRAVPVKATEAGDEREQFTIGGDGQRG